LPASLPVPPTPAPPIPTVVPVPAVPAAPAIPVVPADPGAPPVFVAPPFPVAVAVPPEPPAPDSPLTLVVKETVNESRSKATILISTLPQPTTFRRAARYVPPLRPRQQLTTRRQHDGTRQGRERAGQTDRASVSPKPHKQGGATYGP